MSGDLIKIKFGNVGEVVVHLKKNKAADRLLKALPFTSKAIKWKEEVYFSTPVAAEGRETGTVEPGTAALWRPENSLCLFHGFNNPYGKVIEVGSILGPLHYLRFIDDGSEVHVQEYEEGGRLGYVARFLRGSGILAAARVWEECGSIVALVERGRPFRFEIFAEDYGFIVESEPLFRYDESLNSRRAMALIGRALRFGRRDINEEGYAIISGFAEEREKLPALLRNLALDFAYIEKILLGA